MRNAYKSEATKPATKRPLFKPKRRWEDNIKINITKKQDVRVRTGFRRLKRVH
jgi:hypothetical protein